MTKGQLLEAGYKEHNAPSLVRPLYQKRVVDGQGTTLYFINVEPLEAGDWASWTPSVQYTLPNERHVEVSCIQWYNSFQNRSHDHRIEDAEQFFARAFVALGAIPCGD